MDAMERAATRGRASGFADGVTDRLARLRAEEPSHPQVKLWEDELERCLGTLEEIRREDEEDRDHLTLVAAAFILAIVTVAGVAGWFGIAAA